MNATRLLQLLDSAASPRVLVLGDMMLDVYTTGRAERISPEAPVIVLQAREQKRLLGGAANVSHMLRGLGAAVTCAGILGNDDAGTTVGQLLDQSQINRDLLQIDSARPTTVKERFLGASASRTPSQILRVDRETREAIRPEIETSLLRGLCERLPGHDALLISDYGKGLCTPRLVQGVLRAARQAGIPALIDPIRGGNYEPYRGATVIKPNRSEAELATGITIDRPMDAVRAGHRLCEQLDIQCAVVTLDRDGMVLVNRQGHQQLFPTTARTVCDITGAGDMVLAMLGFSLGARHPVAEAIQLANIAASLEVQRIGVAVISKDEIRQELLTNRRDAAEKIVNLDQAARLAAMYRRNGQRVVFTNGCFDLLHVGHVTSLSTAAQQGDVLFVGVNSDASVRRLKGPTRPVIGEADRARMLAALACITGVIVFDDDTPHRLLEAIRPDVLVKGGTYTTDQVVGHEVVQAYGGKVMVTPVIEGASTTNILQSAFELQAQQHPPRRAA